MGVEIEGSSFVRCGSRGSGSRASSRGQGPGLHQEPDPVDLAGRSGLVTGAATRGIGRATARALAAAPPRGSGLCHRLLGAPGAAGVGVSLFVLSLAGAAVAAAEGESYVSDRLRYRAELPRGWEARRDGRELRPASGEGGAAPGGINVGFKTVRRPDVEAFLRGEVAPPLWAKLRNAKYAASGIQRRGEWLFVEIGVSEPGRPAHAIVVAARASTGGHYTASFFGDVPWHSRHRSQFDRFLDSFARTRAEITYREHRDARKRFELDLPAAPWRLSSSEPGDTLRLWGEVGPGAYDTPALLSVRHFRTGSGFEDAEEYLRVQASGGTLRKAGPVVPRRYPGGLARVMETQDVIDPRGMPHFEGRPPIEETSAYAVFSRDDAFVVIEYSAPVSIYADFLPAFERALSSFRFAGCGASQGDPC